MTKLFIKELDLISFGKFENKKLTFSEDFNLIFGKNETGKSTLASFVEGLLYGFDEGKKKRSFSYKKNAYRPISSYKYAGSGIFSKDGKEFKVYRNFDDGSYKIIDLENNSEISSKPTNLNYPGEFLLGIDYDIYKNYLASFQSQKADSRANNKLLEKLANHDIDYNFSTNKALGLLENEYTRLGSSRAYTKPFLKIKNEINEIKERLYEIKLLKNTYRTDFRRLDRNREELSKVNENYKKLKKVNDSFKNYRATSNYRDYKKWSDELYKINENMSEFDDVKGLDDDYLSELESQIDLYRKNDSSLAQYFIFALFLASLILGIFANKKFFIVSALMVIVFFALSMDRSSEFGLDELNKYNKKKSRYLKYKNLIKEKEKIEEVLAILKKQDINDAGLIDVGDFDFENYNFEKSEQDLEDLLDKINKISKEIQRDEKSLVNIDEKIKDEVDLVDRLKYLEKKLEEITKKKKAIKLAQKTIKKLMDENRGDFSKLNIRINDIVKEISKNSYESISFDKNLSPNIITKEGYKLTLDQVSTGFMDQVSFALKLSLNEEVFSNIFIVYDDAFINYDMERLRNALFFLLDASCQRQVLYFSCHTREEEIFKSEGIEINYINMEDVWYMQLQICILIIQKQNPWKFLGKGGLITRRGFSLIGKV